MNEWNKVTRLTWIDRWCQSADGLSGTTTPFNKKLIKEIKSLNGVKIKKKKTSEKGHLDLNLMNQVLISIVFVSKLRGSIKFW